MTNYFVRFSGNNYDVIDGNTNRTLATFVSEIDAQRFLSSINGIIGVAPTQQLPFHSLGMNQNYPNIMYPQMGMNQTFPMQNQMMQQPIYQQPNMQNQMMQQPIYQQPNMQNQMMQQPIYQQPALQQPIYQQPALQQQAITPQPIIEKPDLQPLLKSDSFPTVQNNSVKPSVLAKIEADIERDELDLISKRKIDFDDNSLKLDESHFVPDKLGALIKLPEEVTINNYDDNSVGEAAAYRTADFENFDFMSDGEPETKKQEAVLSTKKSKKNKKK